MEKEKEIAEITTVNTDCPAQTAEQNFGKFADAEQLLKAYGSLEKEFTKKCQRIKELESTLPDGQAVKSGTALENEQQQTPCYARQDWAQTVDNFVRQNPGAQEFADEIAAFIVNDRAIALSPNALDTAYLSILKEKFVSPQKLATDESYLEKFIFSNEKIKRRIISDYLDSLQSGAVPPVISGESGNIFLTPPKRPKTVREASALAEKYFGK